LIYKSIIFTNYIYYSLKQRQYILQERYIDRKQKKRDKDRK